MLVYIPYNWRGMGDDLELYWENVCFCTNVFGLNGKKDL